MIVFDLAGVAFGWWSENLVCFGCQDGIVGLRMTSEIISLQIICAESYPIQIYLLVSSDSPALFVSNE